MARRLRQQRFTLFGITIGVPVILLVLIFVGVPVVLVALAASGRLFSGGNSEQSLQAAQQYVREAEELAQQGNMAEAARRWAAAWGPANDAARNSRNPDVHFLLARVAMHQNPPSFRYAIPALQMAISLKSDYLEAQRMLTDLYMRVKWWPEAGKECEKLIKMTPDDGRNYVSAAVIDMGQASTEKETNRGPFYQKMIEHCQAGLEKSPQTLELYQLLAVAYESSGQPEKVDEVVDQAIAKNPELGDAYVMKARRWMAQGRFKEAETLLGEALAKVPDTPAKAPDRARLYVTQGEVALQQRSINGALEAFRKAIACDPKSETSYLRLSTLLRASDKRDEALEMVRQGLQQLPGSLPMKVEEADLLLESPHPEEAEPIVDDIRKNAPPDAAAVYYLAGKRAMTQGKVLEAISLLEQARDRQWMPQTSLLLAQAYMAAEELGAAQHELDTLTAKMPGLFTAWRMQAQVALFLHDMEKASKCARIVLGNNGNDIDMHLLLAQTLALGGRPVDALHETELAIDLAKNDPKVKDNPDPLLLAAEILREQNNLSAAEARLQEALAVTKTGGDDAQTPKPGRYTGRVYQRFLRFYTDTGQRDKIPALLEKAKKDLASEQYIVVLEADPQTLERELVDRSEKDSATAADMMALARFYQLTERADKAKEYLRKAMDKATAGSAEWRQAWQQQFFLDLATDETFKSAADLVGELEKVDPSAEELLFARPILAMSQNRLDKAEADLREVLKTHRSLSQAHYLLGQILAQNRKLDDALAELGQALDQKPTLSQARLLRGRIYMRQGNLNAALRDAKEGLKYAPRLVQAMDLRAVASAGLGDWATAVAAREDIRRLVPDNVGNLITLGALYVSLHKNDKAEDVFKATYTLSPDNLAVVRAFAVFYAESGRPADGQKLIETYLAKPEHAKQPAAWVVRGEYASRVGKPADAEPFYRKAIELDPKNPTPLVLIGDDYARTSAWDKAVSLYQEAIRLAPTLLETKRHLADVYMLQGNLDEAMRTVNEVLEARPTDASSMVVKGRILLRMDKPQEARALMEKALKIEPEYGEAKVRLAELFAGTNPEKAIEILTDIDPSDPAFEKAMLILSEVHARLSKLSDAIFDLRRLLDFRPVSMGGRMALASRYAAKGDHDKAIEVLQDMAKQSQYQDAGLLVLLGDEQSRMSNFKDALSNYQKARLLRPDSAEALGGECKCLVALKQPNEAERQAYRALEDPANKGAVWPRLALAAVYESTDRPEQALDAIRNGLLQKPDWEAGYVYLADMLMRRNRPDDARRMLQDGLKAVPESLMIRTGLATIEVSTGHSDAARGYLEPLATKFEALYGSSDDNLGPERLDKLRPYLVPIRIYSLTLYNLGRTDEALVWGMKLWHADPTDIANANNMAWILAVDKKDYVKAGELIDRCRRLVPNHPQVLDTAGWIAFLTEKYKEAEEYLLASIKYGDNAQAHYHLGQLYEKRDRPKDAQAEYQSAVRMGLAGDDAKDAAARLVKLTKP